MLVGYIEYRLNGRMYKYNVEGVDSSSGLSLHLTSMNYDAILLMSNPDMVDNGDALWERRVDVGLSKIKVQTAVNVVNGKKVKSSVNADLFCRLGALIRYAKVNCRASNEQGYTGLQLASGEFEVSVEGTYIIKFPMNDSEVFATVTLNYGDIYGLELNTDDFRIVLNNDIGTELKLFPAIKDGWQSGFMFNEEYLGFPLKPQINTISPSSNVYYSSIAEIIEAHPEKELEWLLGKDYKIVTDDMLEEVFNYIMSWDGLVAYDTETTGLNINFKSRVGQADQLVGVVLSVKYGESFFFPTQMRSIPNLCGGDHWYFMEKYMRPILEGKKLIAHNMSFDWKVAYIYDINANIVHDTMALIKLTIGAERKNWKIGLKENTKIILKRDALELSDLVVDDSWGEGDVCFWDLPAESVRLYACADTDNTLGLLEYAEKADLLNKYNARKVYEIEIAFSFAVAYQEFYGHRIDVNNLDKIREDISTGQSRCMDEMVKMIGHEFNPNSPKHLIQIMYTELGIPAQISRKTGRPTTDKETLEKLSKITDIEGNVKYPFCKLLQEFREYEGVRKIIDKFPEHATEDGYIFSSIMQYGTTTGRVSVNNPNYQSYNDPIKKNVVPRPGCWMFDTDYSSIEYRVLGNMVGNKKIMENFKDPDFDYHSYQAAHMYGVPYSAVDKKMRKAAKGINFGLPYGMGDESLGIRVFGEASQENTRKAGALRTAYFNGQEDIRDWFEYHRDKGVREGFTETFFGRRRYYHRDVFSVNAIRRQAGNQVVQGSAADIYKTAVGRVFKRICKEGWLGKVFLTGFIHDELLGEVSNEINPAVFLKALREEFEVKITNQDGTPWSPLYMGFGYGMSWYEAKSVELPIKLQWEIADKYGVSGFSNWNGDGRAFCDTIPDMLRDFDVRDIRNQLLDPESQGKEIKPALNKQLASCIQEDAKLYNECICNYIQEGDYQLAGELGDSKYLELHQEDIEGYLDKNCHIQSLFRTDDGDFAMDFKPSKSTQDCIDLFCKLHDVDRSKVNLLDIEEYEGSEVLENGVDYYSGYYDEETTDNLQSLMDTRVDTLGLYLDTDNKRIILKMVPKNYMDFIQARVNREGKGYKIRFKDCENSQFYDCEAWLDSSEINIIQSMYLQYFKNIGC